MSNSESAIRTNPGTSGTRSWLGLRIGKRGMYWGLAAVLLAAGLALNWSWLVAVGIAPLLVALAPCAAMCALGLCMRRGTGESCGKQAGPAQETPPVEAAAAPGEIQDPAGQAAQTEASAHAVRTTAR